MLKAGGYAQSGGGLPTGNVNWQPNSIVINPALNATLEAANGDLDLVSDTGDATLESSTAVANVIGTTEVDIACGTTEITLTPTGMTFNPPLPSGGGGSIARVTSGSLEGFTINAGQAEHDAPDVVLTLPAATYLVKEIRFVFKCNGDYFIPYTTGNSYQLLIYDDAGPGTVLGIIGYRQDGVTQEHGTPINCSGTMTPSAGSHIFSLRAIKSAEADTAILQCGNAPALSFGYPDYFPMEFYTEYVT